MLIQIFFVFGVGGVFNCVCVVQQDVEIVDMVYVGFGVYCWYFGFNMWVVEDVFFGFFVFLVEIDFFVWIVGDIYLLVVVFVLVD